MKSIIIVLVIVAVLGFGYMTLSNNSNIVSIEGQHKIVVYKSPTCGCCANYISYLKKEGYEVEVKNSDILLDQIKSENNIPGEVESCHTSLIDGYFVEGHIPLEAIEKLMTEEPDIAGIAMPGMPSGSPGMPGQKYGEFIIYAVNHDGTYNEFMRI